MTEDSTKPTTNKHDLTINESASSIPPENIRQMTTSAIRKGPLSSAKFIVDSLQSTTAQRSPPNDKKTTHIRLISIPLSHYCEKVRWGLDLIESNPTNPFYYTEDGHPPVLASFHTVPASRGEASMTPMVTFRHSTDKNATQCLFDSTKILKHFCSFLYRREEPSLSQQIETLEDFLDQNLGAPVRCLVYHANFSIPKYHPSIIKAVTLHTSIIETILFQKLFPKPLMYGMKKAMNIDDDTAKASADAVTSIFHDISQRLDKDGGQEYILGTQAGFTAVDLTFASLTAPLLLPKELAAFYSEEGPPSLSKLREDLLQTSAGRHAIRTYHNHRFGVGVQPRPNVDMPPRIVIPKSLGRNRPFYVACTVLVGAVTGSLVSYASRQRARL